MSFPFSCDQITSVKLLHNYGKDSNCCWERAEWERSNILCRAKTTVMARWELAQVVLFLFFPGHAFPLPYVRVVLSRYAFCGISSTIKGWIDYRHSFCCVGKEFLKRLWKCFSEDCLVAWLSSYCKNKEHLCKMMQHTILHDSFLSPRHSWTISQRPPGGI